jgi:hypothetical protein
LSVLNRDVADQLEIEFKGVTFPQLKLAAASGVRPSRCRSGLPAFRRDVRSPHHDRAAE